ncbi:TonB-dependent receptor plug domain-containing protein [Parvularcula maris]|uniref:TonB-dependent receptor n=1 Tax=Parvularcula maris TaxID=2965077 RepID=A0A9X2RJL0_9PROT|nr:TonB-dependent receptor [Parvularcula maris]MCQ8185971.1 TonB-dependent receptor [Parvularcula maris]
MLLTTILLSTAAAVAPPDEIVVRGTRLEQRLLDSGTSISVIDREDLVRLGDVFLADSLATVPGVTLNRNGPLGGAASLRIRGAGTDQTLVLIDGVPVGDTASPGGGFDLSRLAPSQIERVEVLRGPQSALWGSEAIGGVVAITTRRTGGAPLAGFAEGGSFGTLRAGISAAAASGANGVRLSLSGITSDGISKADEEAGNTEEDGFDSFSGTLSSNTEFAGTRIDTSFHYQTAETETDGFVSGAPGNVGDTDNETDTEEFGGSLRFAFPEFGGGWNQSFLAGYRQLNRKNETGGTETFSAKGERTTLRYQLNSPSEAPLRTALGGEADLREADGRSTSILSAFAVGEAEITERLTLSAGLRADDHEEFGTEVTSRLAAAFRAHDYLTFRANYGEGFKAPSLFQETFFCCGSTEPNLDLQPERSRSYEIGAAFVRERTSLDVAVFKQDTDDLIDFDFASGTYINIAEAETTGVELGLSQTLGSIVTATLSYTYLDAENGEGDRLARVPRHSGTTFLFFDPEGPFAGQLSLRANSEEEDSFGITPGWITLDSQLSYDIGEKVQLYLRAENLLDADYQEVFGFGTLGRSAFLGLRFNP